MATPDATEPVLRLWEEGRSGPEIAAALGITPWRARRLLREAGVTGLVVVRCCRCGRAITRGQRGLKGNGNALCLDCLGARQVPFGQRLRAYRLAAGLTQDELAERSALSTTSIWQYEQGEAVPRAGTLARLVESLGPGLVASAAAAVRPRGPRQVGGRRVGARPSVPGSGT